MAIAEFRAEQRETQFTNADYRTQARWRYVLSGFGTMDIGPSVSVLLRSSKI